MDVQTKIKMFCECEIARARIAAESARDKYMFTRSALVLADFTAASQVLRVTERVCNAVLDLMLYHYEG